MSQSNGSELDYTQTSGPFVKKQVGAVKTRILYLLIAGLAAVAIIQPILQRTAENANELINSGRSIFRFDTFGDEAFWGGTLQLHKAIEGANFGGVGLGISPNEALNLGLKVDVDHRETSCASFLSVSHSGASARGWC